jgi:hypothetical protein
MASPTSYVKTQAITGNLNGVTAGTATPGPVVSTNLIEPDTVSCEFTILAETNTLTIEGRWQVSDDNSTWVDMPLQNNAAVVVIGTGTAGADSAVTLALQAPYACVGYRYVRPVVVNRVATGATGDTYSMTVRYQKRRNFQN